MNNSQIPKGLFIVLFVLFVLIWRVYMDLFGGGTSNVSYKVDTKV